MQLVQCCRVGFAVESYLCFILVLCLVFLRRRGVYICSRLFRILAHADLFGIFHLFTLFLEEFDYTARVQHALVAVKQK